MSSAFSAALPALCALASAAPAVLFISARAVGSEAPPDGGIPAFDVPLPPSDLRARVRDLRQAVGEFDRDCLTLAATASGPRRTGDACRKLHSQLSAGGAAAAHAVGGYLLSPTEEEKARVEARVAKLGSADRSASVRALLRLLATSKVKEAMPFAIAYARRAARASPAATVHPDALLALNTLEQISGSDPAPVARWQINNLPRTRLDAAVAAWEGWWRDHAHQSREAWLADGLRLAREALSSSDPVVRSVAIERLAQSTADREAVVHSLRGLLDRPDLEEYSRRCLVQMADEYELAVRSSARNGGVP